MEGGLLEWAGCIRAYQDSFLLPCLQQNVKLIIFSLSQNLCSCLRNLRNRVVQHECRRFFPG